MTDAAPAPDCNIPAPTSEQRDALGRRVGSAYVVTTLVLALGACAAGFVAGAALG